MDTPSTTYIPGICNINYAEIKRRKTVAYLGLLILLIAAGVLFVLGANRWLRVILFIPAFLMMIGFLQAKNKFCVAYGAAGLQNATDGSVTASKVEVEAARIDKARAHKMNLQAVGVSLIFVVVAVTI